MATKLTYPPLPDGYRWNLLNKIFIKTGYWPGTSTTSNFTYIHFIEDLTAPEIALVDGLMASPNTVQDPGMVEIAGNSATIKDIWEFKSDFETDAGRTCEIFYGESVPDSGVFDLIHLKFHEILNNPAKNAVESAYGNLFTWDV
jgi:hypothetical protein